MAWQEEILKAGGVAAAAIGLIGVAVTGAVTYLNNERIADNQRMEIVARYRLERDRMAEKRQDTLCASTFQLLQDETPGPLLGKGGSAVITKLIENNVANCGVSPILAGRSGEER